DRGNDPGIEARLGASDFPIRKCFSYKYAHAARNDPVAGERTFGLDHVCQEGRTIQKQGSPHTNSGVASDDLVPQARRLNDETTQKVSFFDRSPVHRSRGQVYFSSLELLPTSRRIR